MFCFQSELVSSGHALDRELRFLEEDSGFPFLKTAVGAAGGADSKHQPEFDSVSVDTCALDTAGRAPPTPRLKTASELQSRGGVSARQTMATPSGRRTPGVGNKTQLAVSARAASPTNQRRARSLKPRSGSATVNTNNMSNIYNNNTSAATQSSTGGGGGGGARSNKARYPSSKIHRSTQRKSARSNASRMREKQTIYSNLSTARFFAQQSLV